MLKLFPFEVHSSSDSRHMPKWIGSFIGCLLLFAISVSSVSSDSHHPKKTPVQSYFEWTELQFDTAVYAQRRQRLMQALEFSQNSLFVTASHSGKTMGATFRQLDEFMYFTGLELPQSVLVIDPKTDSTILFTPGNDPRFTNPGRQNDFPGRPLATDPELGSKSGIADIRPLQSLENVLKSWSSVGRNIRVSGARSSKVEPANSGLFAGSVEAGGLINYLSGLFPARQVLDASPMVARLRMVKGPEEIEVMRHAADLTIRAIVETAAHVSEGVDEKTLEGILESVFKSGGAQRPAFDSIIKSGPNSLWPWRILAAHNDRRNRAMVNGDLVIFDVGAEVDYYVTDVGRTFPVSGRFSTEQRRALEMQITVADAIIAAVRPGVTFTDLMAVAHKTIPPDQRKYMQTGSFFGHHIGMSPGDPNLFDEPLTAGMIFTVEPWYYNHGSEISVFTEDVVLVTNDGCEVLTSALPRSPADLERMVGFQNQQE